MDRSAGIQRAEKVCHSYYCVGIMCRNGFIPTNVVADSWGDSLRTCWNGLQPLVEKYRSERNPPQLWDEFPWLAERAVELHRTGPVELDSPALRE
ncbi:DUF4760 domain-containing protein [Nocardia sp. X0981]